MKKLAVAMIAVMLTSVAFAATIAVPFFKDNHEDATAATLPSAAKGFIGVLSNADEDKVIHVFYYDNAGDSMTNPDGNTFTLVAGTAKSWRPTVGIATDSLLPSTGAVGAAVLAWDGDASDLQGRYSQGEFEFGARIGQAMYLLPAGVPGI